jgi:hypothetical protein
MKGKGSLRSQPNPSVQPELTASAHFKRDIRAVLDLRTFADLHERLRSKRYRHQALRRNHVPKGKGQWRPIGISAFEDKIVQDAVREVMAAVCEQDFLDCSYGFRPKRSAHDARSASGAVIRESLQRRSRMVEISLSGSGEGRGRAIARGYSTEAFATKRALHLLSREAH